MHEQAALQNALRSRLDTLRIRYPRYSVRAFARRVGVSPATLSLVLQGKRKVSRKLAERLGDKLALDPQESAEVLSAFRKRAEPAPAEAYTSLRVDQYQLLADWRAFAVLSLLRTKGFRPEPAWIARRLGISPEDARAVVERLVRLGMLRREAGRLVRAEAKYKTTEDVANLSLRASHRQTLELAHASLDSDPVGGRDFSWVTLPLDPALLPLAKKRIREFEDRLTEELERNGARPTEVYRLAVQLFPLTKTSGEPS